MKLTVDGTRNTRDLCDIPCFNGRKIKKGRILRSAHLSYLTDDGADFLRDYGLKKVVDFRTDDEIESSPDYIIDGVEYLRCPIIKELTVGVTPKKEEKDPDPAKRLLNLAVFMGKGAKEWMIELYKPLVSDEFSLNHYREFLDILKNSKDGAVLYHCTSGKDRVGVGTMMLLFLLGASKEDIIEDFMLTNESVENRTQGAMKLGEELGVASEVIDIIPYVNGVDVSYLETAFSIMEKDFSSPVEFIKVKLGIDDEYINELRNNYLD